MTPISFIVPINENSNIPVPRSAKALRELYHSVFCELTMCDWTRIVAEEVLIDMVGHIDEARHLTQNGKQKVAERLKGAIWLTDRPIHFFDWIGTLKNIFFDLDGSPSVYPVRAIIQKLSQVWPIGITVEGIATLKGLATHLADEKGSRDLIERELACLFLRPPLVPKMEVMHQGSGVCGTILSISHNIPGCVEWAPLRSKNTPQIELGSTLLPLVPGLLPSAAPLPLQPITLENVLSEFRAFFPLSQDNLASRPDLLQSDVPIPGQKRVRFFS